MGILKNLLGKEKKPEQVSTLMEDIPKAADWLVRAMASSGYCLDGGMESFRELDRFFEEQKVPGGLLDGKVGNKLFAIGSYMGQVLCKELGGVWETDDSDPQGEINIAVRFQNGAAAWPVQRTMRRFQNGAADSLYAYGVVLRQTMGDTP